MNLKMIIMKIIIIVIKYVTFIIIMIHQINIFVLMIINVQKIIIN